ncbi:hypothetical protein LARV_00216 [Longilinea arvoryzae]|uniref:Uncharacterized protein n=1 Tax=Longilinea arvoryzae TaxID=360412 RepID=A0A0S7BFD6_9CHLR|nr:hypothetical protein [Longilinea arvoryzae]GAP12481.1 hypothetical protein LARV_00216 [Longilinea arvoryzae]
MDKNRTVREIITKNKKWKVRVSAASGGTYEIQVLRWMDAGGYCFWEETGAALRVGERSSAELLAQKEARRLG